MGAVRSHVLGASGRENGQGQDQGDGVCLVDWREDGEPVRLGCRDSGEAAGDAVRGAVPPSLPGL